MKNILFYKVVFILIILNSCSKNRSIENDLQKTSKKYFKDNNLLINDYKSDYYILETPVYTHYILKYSRVYKKDTLLIYFSRDDEAKQFIEGNKNFYKYNKINSK